MYLLLKGSCCKIGPESNLESKTYYLILEVRDGQYKVEWTSHSNPVEKPVRIQETNEVFETLAEAIVKAASNGLSTFTIEIIGDVTEIENVIVKSSITIVGAEGTHTISNCRIQVKDGGSLTLGDGTTTNLLTILGSMTVTDGDINIQDGIKINSANTVLNLSGPNVSGIINGGILNGYNTALNMEKGAKLNTISGGTFTGRQNALYITDEGTYIDVISGGRFYQTDTTVTLHGHAVFVQNEAQIGEISGGYFEAIRNCALFVIRGAWIEAISGGEFVATRKGTVQDGNDPDSWNSVLRIEAEKNVKTGVGTISGGVFHGGARFGILLINYFGSTAGPRIDLICGGVIQGAGVGLQPDVNSYVGEISGGTITGNQGILNAGTINKISENAKISGITSYGIYNYVGGKINEISGGTISTTSNSENGIANAGIIDKISGGTIIGGWSAISCTGLNPGKLNIITGGVFYAKLYTTITIAYPLQLEPDLATKRGLGRFRSGNANIFSNEDLVKYPDGGYYMSLQTMPVEGILGVEFRYLTIDDKYIIEYELNGGVNDDENPLVYDETDLPCLIVDPTKTGYDFQGWMIKNNTGVFGPVINYSIPVGSTGDFTLIATWSADKVTYSVYYYLQNSKIPLAPSKTITDQTIDTLITESAITIAGYTVLQPTTISANLNATDNTFIFYYAPNSNSGGSGSNNCGSNGGNRKGSQTNKPANTPPPTTTPPLSENKEEPVEMWALVNLVLSVAGFILAIAMSIYVLLQRKKKQEKKTQINNSNNVDYEKSEKQTRQHRNLWLAITIALGIAGIIVFLFTEDLSRTITLVDNWTIVNAIIFVVEIIVTAFIFKNKKQHQNNENINNTSPTHQSIN